MVCLESKQVVTGGQFKRLNTLLFLTKFSFQRLLKKLNKALFARPVEKCDGQQY